jgi:hypothetical protein
VQCERGKLDLELSLDGRGRATELFLQPEGRCGY